MSDEKSTPKFGLEEYIILIPFVISVVLTLITFVMKPFSPENAGVMTKLSYYAYAWLCCISVSQCVRRDKHLQICLFDGMFPAPVAKAMNLISQFIGFLVVVGVFVGSFSLLTNALSTGAMDAKTPQIPLALGYFAPVFGYGLALVRYAMRVIKGGNKK
jgi:TRAP-type C4-dicarboxylate transport system permease small subunit